MIIVTSNIIDACEKWVGSGLWSQMEGHTEFCGTIWYVVIVYKLYILYNLITCTCTVGVKKNGDASVLFRPVQTESKWLFPMPKNGNRTGGGDTMENAVDYSSHS